jgi:hypothetical protein
MALINFRSTTYFKAFLLYAFISSIIAHLAIMLHVSLNEKSQLYNFINPLTPEKGINHTNQFIIGTIISFVIGFFIYNIMYFLFGWGGGMIVPMTSKCGKKVYKTSYF